MKTIGATLLAACLLAVTAQSQPTRPAGGEAACCKMQSAKKYSVVKFELHQVFGGQLPDGGFAAQLTKYLQEHPTLEVVTATPITTAAGVNSPSVTTAVVVVFAEPTT
jgi:hypothetical protein